MSTVHLCLNDIFGVAVACEVIFQPGDTPFLNGGALAVSGARSIRLDADGNGSVTLLPGRYAVRFAGITNNTDTLLILVPDDDAEYALPSLICGGNWVLPLRDFLQKTRNLEDVADAVAAFAAIKQPASEAASGVVQLATAAEAEAGADTTKAVTPATLRGVLGGRLGQAGYELKSSAFTAMAGGAYALDTSNGSFNVTIDADLPVGGFIDFCDAEGTWNTNPPTFLRNGHLFDGFEVDYTDSAQGTFLRIVNADGTKGLRILESGTKPNNLGTPTITGQYVWQSFQSTTGAWTGSPTVFLQQWQVSDDGVTGWVDIEGATTATFTPGGDLDGKYIRVNVSAANANGTSSPAASAASVQLSQTPYPFGTVAYWRLDEESGTRADATGNGYDLTDNNGVGYTAGVMGNAARFTGPGNHRYLSNPLLPAPQGSWTLTCWAKVDSVSGWNQAIQFFDSVFLFAYHSGNGTAGAYINGLINPGIPVADTDVHFLVLRYNSEAGVTTLFVDEQKTELFLTPPLGGDGTPGITIGSYGPQSVNDMTGFVDEVGLWDRALADEEISALYNNGNGLPFPA